jgi:hypothetical protein
LVSMLASPFTSAAVMSRMVAHQQHQGYHAVDGIVGQVQRDENWPRSPRGVGFKPTRVRRWRRARNSTRRSSAAHYRKSGRRHCTKSDWYADLLRITLHWTSAVDVGRILGNVIGGGQNTA